LFICQYGYFLVFLKTHNLILEGRGDMRDARNLSAHLQQQSIFLTGYPQIAVLLLRYKTLKLLVGQSAPFSFELIESTKMLAWMLMRLGHYHDSGCYFDEVAQIPVLTTQHARYIGDIKDLLANNACYQGKFSQAEAYARAAQVQYDIIAEQISAEWSGTFRNLSAGHLGWALLGQSKFEQASELFVRALEVNRLSTFARLMLHSNAGHAYWQAGDSAAAAKHCHQAVKLFEKHNIGIPDYRKMLVEQPSHKVAHILTNIGLAYYILNKFAAADAVLQHAIAVYSAKQRLFDTHRSPDQALGLAMAYSYLARVQCAQSADAKADAAIQAAELAARDLPEPDATLKYIATTRSQILRAQYATSLLQHTPRQALLILGFIEEASYLSGPVAARLQALASAANADLATEGARSAAATTQNSKPRAAGTIAVLTRQFKETARNEVETNFQDLMSAPEAVPAALVTAQLPDREQLLKKVRDEFAHQAKAYFAFRCSGLLPAEDDFIIQTRYQHLCIILLTGVQRHALFEVVDQLLHILQVHVDQPPVLAANTRRSAQLSNIKLLKAQLNYTARQPLPPELNNPPADWPKTLPWDRARNGQLSAGFKHTLLLGMPAQQIARLRDLQERCASFSAQQ
jgi:hypothetical protein